MISIENLNFNYTRKTILRNNNLNLISGKIYALLGGNGVGKTTFLKLLSGIYKENTGYIYFNNLGTNKTSRKHLSVSVIENSDFPPKLSVNDLINYIKHINNFEIVENEMYIKLYEIFNIESFSTLKIEELSLGMKHKLYLTTAFLNNSDFIFLDEPLSSLDISSKIRFLTFLEEIKTNKVIVMSSHEEDLLLAVADFILNINNYKLSINNTDKGHKYLIVISDTLNTETLKKTQHLLLSKSSRTIITKVIHIDDLNSLCNSLNESTTLTLLRAIDGVQDD